MAFLAPPTLHKIAAVVYGLLAPGHVIFGFQNVYPGLQEISTDKPSNRAARTGSKLCWEIVTTALIAQSLMHWKWSQTGASSSREEAIALLGMSAHMLWNGTQYLRIGEAAGPLLILAATTGITALIADLRA